MSTAFTFAALRHRLMPLAGVAEEFLARFLT